MNDAARELGPEAMLVYSREAPPEARYLGDCEVVFALPPKESPDGSPAASLAAPEDWGMRPEQESAKLAGEVADLRRQISRMSGTLLRSHSLPGTGVRHSSALAEMLEELVEAGLSTDLAQDIAFRLERSDEVDIVRAEAAEVRGAARRQLDEMFQVDSRIGVENDGKRVVALVGPPGAGKTTTLVKLAAAYGLRSRTPVQLLSVDTWRIGGAEQLRSYAAILGVGFQAIETAGALSQALEEHRHKNLILIDTPGFAERDADAACALVELLSSHDDVDVHLTLSASMKAADLTRAVSRFEGFRPAKLIFTRLDETVSLGTVLNEAVRTAKPISFLAGGQRIPEDLLAASKPVILDLVFGRASEPFQPQTDESSPPAQPLLSGQPGGTRAAAA